MRVSAEVNEASSTRVQAGAQKTNGPQSGPSDQKGKYREAALRLVRLGLEQCVALDTDTLDQRKLGFKIIDMFLFIVQDLAE